MENPFRRAKEKIEEIDTPRNRQLATRASLGFLIGYSATITYTLVTGTRDGRILMLGKDAHAALVNGDTQFVRLWSNANPDVFRVTLEQ